MRIPRAVCALFLLLVAGSAGAQVKGPEAQPHYTRFVAAHGPSAPKGLDTLFHIPDKADLEELAPKNGFLPWFEDDACFLVDPVAVGFDDAEGLAELYAKIGAVTRLSGVALLKLQGLSPCARRALVRRFTQYGVAIPGEVAKLMNDGVGCVAVGPILEVTANLGERAVHIAHRPDDVSEWDGADQKRLLISSKTFPGFGAPSEGVLGHVEFTLSLPLKDTATGFELVSTLSKRIAKRLAELEAAAAAKAAVANSRLFAPFGSQYGSALPAPGSLVRSLPKPLQDKFEQTAKLRFREYGCTSENDALNKLEGATVVSATRSVCVTVGYMATAPKGFLPAGHSGDAPSPQYVTTKLP